MNKILITCVAYLMLFVATGCHKHDHDHEHDHSHEESLQLSGYSSSFELFAEVTPMTVGEDCDVLAHVTRLDNFKPIGKGVVTATLTVGGSTLTQKQETARHEGIYLFEFTPEKSGKGILSFEIISEGVKENVSIPVTVYAEEHEAHEAAGKMSAKSPDGVAFTKEQSWKIDFSTEEVVSRQMSHVIRAMASVQPTQGNEAVVAARTSGIVHIDGNSLIAGSLVSAGQKLFSVSTKGMPDNDLAVKSRSARSEYEFAQKEYERKKHLADDKLITQSELLEAKNAYERAKAEYDNLHNYSEGGSAGVSPMSGYIKQINVKNGEYVEAGQPVMTVTDSRQLYLKAELPSSDHRYISNIYSANLRLPGRETTISIKELGGKIVSYGRSVDAENPQIPVTLQINNTLDLLPGSWVETYLLCGIDGYALTVPTEGIVEEIGNKFVFVQLTPEYFEKRLVKTGRNDGVHTEILSGVKEGERVVGRGATMVKLAQGSGALDPHAGHVH